ncbi:hypothetical protein EDC96DRAFT_561341 [Choanephora cucurbitarum]|nr:hypothetical protein EDC96DRAFT_561341 [Choanephora cucurbitarum]
MLTDLNPSKRKVLSEITLQIIGDDSNEKFTCLLSYQLCLIQFLNHATFIGIFLYFVTIFSEAFEEPTLYDMQIQIRLPSNINFTFKETNLHVHSLDRLVKSREARKALAFFGNMYLVTKFRPSTQYFKTVADFF